MLVKKCPNCKKKTMVELSNGCMCTSCGCHITVPDHFFQDGPIGRTVLPKKFGKRR